MFCCLQLHKKDIFNLVKHVQTIHTENMKAVKRPREEMFSNSSNKNQIIRPTPLLCEFCVHSQQRLQSVTVVTNGRVSQWYQQFQNSIYHFMRFASRRFFFFLREKKQKLWNSIKCHRLCKHKTILPEHRKLSKITLCGIQTGGKKTNSKWQ